MHISVLIEKKSIGIDVCLSGLSHCRISEKETTINTSKHLKKRELTKHRKKRQEKTREKRLFAHDEIITIKSMRPCVYGKHFGLCAQNQSTITGSINRNRNNNNSHLCHRSKALFSMESGADLSCTTWWKVGVLVGCATSAAEPTIVAIL